MMSTAGQFRARLPLLPKTSDTGELDVEEYGYGLGPPTGMLVLRYPAGRSVAEFPESRNDYVHQLTWSPDGLLWVRRGASVVFVRADQAVWLRRGVTAEVAACDRQTVLRVCLRQVPEALEHQSAAVVDISALAARSLLDAARPGMADEVGLAARQVLLDEITGGSMTGIAHQAIADGPARAVARALIQDPGDDTSLAEWASRVNVCAKTLQRDFARCFGEPFSAWRTRTRLEASVAMLSRWSVTQTARRVGYASASAFVAAFTKTYGETPGRIAQRRATAVAR
jgi:AraC-like DNA-binding protein